MGHAWAETRQRHRARVARHTSAVSNTVVRSTLYSCLVAVQSVSACLPAFGSASAAHTSADETNEIFCKLRRNASARPSKLRLRMMSAPRMRAAKGQTRSVPLLAASGVLPPSPFQSRPRSVWWRGGTWSTGLSTHDGTTANKAGTNKPSKPRNTSRLGR
jgi:hypothetical protein